MSKIGWNADVQDLSSFANGGSEASEMAYWEMLVSEGVVGPETLSKKSRDMMLSKESFASLREVKMVGIGKASKESGETRGMTSHEDRETPIH